MSNIPTLSADLIDMLDKHYPLRNTRIDQSERLIFFKAGQRDVVESLITKLSREDALQDSLEGELT